MSFRYAGFWVRAIAESIDVAILVLVSTVVELAALSVTSVLRGGEARAGFADAFDPVVLQASLLSLYGVVACTYFTWARHRPGFTLGQRVFGLRVTTADGTFPISWRRSIARSAASVLSLLPLGAGYWVAALHPQKRTLHDLLAGTLVLRG